ncbi:heparan sulfate 2-O-sulfotransferase 1-like [Paramacrobiotus metropolitanus]|uniref:heparan sulfate 2-O-sulfotransferase 1-like n=1 Tax=Paramacrobiotus metropolitanus TaxID=2943436 RepID=UPI002445CD4D|nr:heparan sulfate 2-O-sulfotransferase 1-like [Paramacrobiotus metropolitanus]
MVQFKALVLFVLGFGVFVLGLLGVRLSGLDLEGFRATGNGFAYNFTTLNGGSVLSNGPSVESSLIVVYNRVPKTGSTSFTGLAYELCSRNKFHVLHLNVSKNSHVLSLADRYRFAQNVTRWRDKHPAFFHGHVAFLDFATLGTEMKPVFINIIREPIDRMVSYYYFLRYGDDFRPYLSRRRQGDRKSIDDCVESQGKDCDPSNMWLQVPFFCGHAAACWEPAGNTWALEQAKRNLVDKYFLVGVTEEMEDFVLMLEATLPSMFRGAWNAYKRGDKSHLRKTYNKTTPLQATLDKLQQSDVYKVEAEFYRFAYEQFQFVKKRTLVLRNGRYVDRGQQFFYEKIRPRIGKEYRVR